MKPNDITHTIIGAAIAVHREIGPGQDEVLYEDALEIALQLSALRYRRQPPLPVHYKGVKLDCGFRPDFVVEDAVVAEGKAVELVHPVFAAQVRTYQRLGGWPLGLLLNFNVPVMKEGISRFIVNAGEFRNLQNFSAENGRTQRKTELLSAIIAAAIEVHQILGVGLLNSVYSACFQHELSVAGLKFETGRRVDAVFQGAKLSHPAELGLVIEDKVLVGVFSVQKVLPVHEAQVRSQMRLGGLAVGLVLNFHAKRLVDDLKRFGSLETSVSSKTLR
jgi:GxxExxY protein